MIAREPLLTDAEIDESLFDRASIHYLTEFDQSYVLAALFGAAQGRPDQPLRPVLDRQIAYRLRDPHRGAGRELADRMRLVAGRSR